MGKTHEGLGLGAFKKLVAETVSGELEGVRNEFGRVMSEEGYVEDVARRGAVKARVLADETMCIVRDAMGL